ncbi:MAG: hypothetical protein E3J87_04440 [Candidatus Cloacimonadota bacterium]|nr:MAG: hypothetical protein E3J87_04440 [Candidatus Cloacimonadota bacterium]
MKSSRYILLVLLIVTFLSLSLLYAGRTGKIAGRVVDTDGEALPFANVLILETTMGAVTDINGDYFILNIPPGVYNVQARMMGFHDLTVNGVKVKIDQTSTVNFALPMEVIEVPEIVVYAKKIIERDVTTSKVEMTGEQIERMAVTNPVEALLTGASMVMDPARREIHVRGGRGGEVLYLIDGMEVTDPLVGGGLGISIEDSEIDAMEILTGGFNAEYGFAQSAIVNLVTREGSTKGHSVKVSYKNDHILMKQDLDQWGRVKNSFNNDKAVFSAGGPELVSQHILPALGIKVPWTITYYVSTTGDWTDTHTPYSDKRLNSFLTTYLLWDKIRMQDRMQNTYTTNSKLACRFSSTAKLSLGYRTSWVREFRYSHKFKYIPENAYRRTKGSNQTVADWNHTLSGKTFYTVAVGFFHTEYELTPGGKMSNEINQYPNTSDDPIDIIINIDGDQEPFDDLLRYNGVYDWGEQFIDLNKNGFWDDGEPFTDLAEKNYHYDIGERFRDYNGDGIWTGREPYYDYGMDGIPDNHDSLEGNGVYDEGEWGHEPFEDYNGNGVRDYPLGDRFWEYGFDQWAQWHKRYSDVLSIKGDVTSQITKVHLVKTGIEYKRYEMSMQEIQYPWFKEEGRDPPPPGPWPDRGYFRDFYTRHPSSGALYIQDKIETEGMIINGGLRFDFVYPGWEVSDQREDREFFGFPLMSEYEFRLSPRFGISFPISEFDKMYFSYGHFSQPPEFEYFYQDTTQFSSAIRLYGNANLDCEQTVAYQLGIKHAFGRLTTLELKGFYKDIRGLIDTEQRGVSPFTYQIRVNKDYGSVRGVEVNFIKRHSHFYSISFDYSIMWAMGKSSSDRQGYDYSYQGIPLPLREYPLDWDQRHAVTNVIDLRSHSGEHPVLFGLSLPDKWGMNILTQFATGLPYTPSGKEGEEDVTILPNSARKPYTITTNVKATKFFYLGPLRYEFLLEVRNLFDRSNTMNVYGATGNAHDSTDDGIPGTEYDRNPRNWGSRRQLYFGIALGYEF